MVFQNSCTMGVRGHLLVIGDSLRLNTNFGMCFGALVANDDARKSSHSAAPARWRVIPVFNNNTHSGMHFTTDGPVKGRL